MLCYKPNYYTYKPNQATNKNYTKLCQKPIYTHTHINLTNLHPGIPHHKVGGTEVLIHEQH